MARALRELGAADTNIFIEKAAGAGTRNYAFYFRRRAQILAAHSKDVGGVASFISVAGQPINVLRNGNIVAAFTFDDVVWTDVQSRTFTAATAAIYKIKPGAVPILRNDRRGDADGAGRDHQTRLEDRQVQAAGLNKGCGSAARYYRSIGQGSQPVRDPQHRAHLQADLVEPGVENRNDSPGAEDL